MPCSRTASSGLKSNERHQAHTLPHVVQELQQTFGEELLTDSEWEQFVPRFTGDPAAVLTKRIAEQEAAVTKAATSDGTTPSPTTTTDDLQKCGLPVLKAAYEDVGKLISADQKNLQRLKQLNDLHKTQVTKKERLEADLKRAGGSETRLNAILAERAKLYGRFFELIIEQCDILTDLYAPLATHLADASSSANKLSLRVVRSVDVDAWARAGEELLDLRKNGKFRGRGSLSEAAGKQLLSAWQNGTADEVVAALEAFRAENDESLIAQSPRRTRKRRVPRVDSPAGAVALLDGTHSGSLQHRIRKRTNHTTLPRYTGHRPSAAVPRP